MPLAPAIKQELLTTALRGSIVKLPSGRVDDLRKAGVLPDSRSTAASPETKSPPQVIETTFHRRVGSDDGILVQEGELGTVVAQRMYKMRCECGRSWFELELQKLVKCPACQRINLVSVWGSGSIHTS
jgi:hypothetical protein